MYWGTKKIKYVHYFQTKKQQPLIANVEPTRPFVYQIRHKSACNHDHYSRDEPITIMNIYSDESVNCKHILVLVDMERVEAGCDER